MKLSTLFTRGVVTAKPDAMLSEVAKLMRNHNVGAVVIHEKERPVGIITDRDLALALGASNIAPSVQVRDVMTHHVLAIPDDTDILTATRFMHQRQVRRLPLVDSNDHLVGMVTLDDLLDLLGREFSNLAESVTRELSGQRARNS